jgi:hypothetical protein
LGSPGVQPKIWVTLSFGGEGTATALSPAGAGRVRGSVSALVMKSLRRQQNWFPVWLLAAPARKELVQFVFQQLERLFAA